MRGHAGSGATEAGAMQVVAGGVRENQSPEYRPMRAIPSRVYGYKVGYLGTDGRLCKLILHDGSFTF